MGLIAGRFLSIVTLGMLLLGTTPLLTLIDSMVSLGLPSLLAEMTLLSYRYLFDMADQLANLRQAMRLRGFHPRGNRQSWQQLAAVMGTCFCVVMNNLNGCYKAMQLRGHGYSDTPAKQITGWGQPAESGSHRIMRYYAPDLSRFAKYSSPYRPPKFSQILLGPRAWLLHQHPQGFLLFAEHRHFFTMFASIFDQRAANATA